MRCGKARVLVEKCVRACCSDPSMMAPTALPTRLTFASVPTPLPPTHRVCSTVTDTEGFPAAVGAAGILIPGQRQSISISVGSPHAPPMGAFAWRTERNQERYARSDLIPPPSLLKVSLNTLLCCPGGRVGRSSRRRACSAQPVHCRAGTPPNTTTHTTRALQG